MTRKREYPRFVKNYFAACPLVQFFPFNDHSTVLADQVDCFLNIYNVQSFNDDASIAIIDSKLYFFTLHFISFQAIAMSQEPIAAM